VTVDTTFDIQAPHTEALALLQGKPPVTRQVFDGLLPELRARAFTVTGVEAAGVLQRTRDAVAGIADGERWDDAKKRIVEELDPYLGDGAARRAELILRMNGFQAFQASNWQAVQADEDTTHLQYLSMEDDSVRDTHAALDGVVLPKNDPFWAKHYPPWEWGCRCMTRSMNVDQVDDERRRDESRNPEDKLVVEGAEREQLRNGTLISGSRRYDVTAPSDRPSEGTPFQWHPSNLRLSMAELEARYDAPVWSAFSAWAKSTQVDASTSVWQWLGGKTLPTAAKTAGAYSGLVTKATAAKLEKPVLDKIASLPPEVGKLLENVNIAYNPKKAHYSPSTKTVHVQRKASAWSGHPDTMVHELGHHLHFETGTLTYSKVDPAFRAAATQDLSKVSVWAEEKFGATWKSKMAYGPTSVRYMAEALGYEGDFDGLPVSSKRRVIRFTDALMGISGGNMGYGHKKSYMSKYGLMEAFTHAWTGIVDSDPEFGKLFSGITGQVRKILKL
jgi:SPP1 gp7 family putative phage head morphogenesis protein